MRWAAEDWKKGYESLTMFAVWLSRIASPAPLGRCFEIEFCRNEFCSWSLLFSGVGAFDKSSLTAERCGKIIIHKCLLLCSVKFEATTQKESEKDTSWLYLARSFLHDQQQPTGRTGSENSTDNYSIKMCCSLLSNEALRRTWIVVPAALWSNAGQSPDFWTKRLLPIRKVVIAPNKPTELSARGFWRRRWEKRLLPIEAQ